MILDTLFSEKPPKDFINIKIFDPLASRKQQPISKFFKRIRDAKRLIDKHKDDKQIYFGVCTRNEQTSKHANVSTAYAIWSDIDGNKDVPQFLLPPSIVLDSGNGLHCYWLLESPTDLLHVVEEVNKQVAEVIGGDSVHDVTRILRVDDTFNLKDPDNPKPVEIINTRPVLYTLKDIERACKANPKVIHKAVTGQLKGHKSRSERDYAIVGESVRLGLSDNAIENIFNGYPCGDRADEDPKYLMRTIKKIRDSEGIESPSVIDNLEDAQKFIVQGIYAMNNHYWKKQKKSSKAVSSFIFDPKYKVLPDKRDYAIAGQFNNQEYLMVDVCTPQEVYKDLLLPRKAFRNMNEFSKILISYDWAWYGSDADVRVLPTILNKQIELRDLPIKLHTDKMGFHRHYWIGNKHAINPDTLQTQSMLDSPYILSNDKPMIDVSYVDEKPTEKEVDDFAKHLFNINDQGIMCNIVGWLCASIFNSRLPSNVGFPFLNLYGTRGSGKTTLIHVLQDIIGYDSNRTFNCDTTKFSLLATCCATKDILMSLSEYRKAFLKDEKYLHKCLLLLYDKGHDLRGNVDKSVTTFKLTSPITLDGEDAITDPALMERCLRICMSVSNLDDARELHLQQLRNLDLKKIGSDLIKFSLDKDINTYLDMARQYLLTECKAEMSARVTNNTKVIVAGLYFFKDYCSTYNVDVGWDCEAFDLIVRESHTEPLVYNFICDVINHVSISKKEPEFAYKINETKNHFWFNLKTAAQWWVGKQNRDNGEYLNAKALSSQLKELSTRDKNFMLSTTSIKVDILGKASWYCYGIDVTKASKEMDIPDIIQDARKQMSIKLKGYTIE